VTEGLFLSQTDSRPMYLQMIDQIKLKILAGDWPQGRALPSIRELAVATKVSVITVKRAYLELEHEGLIVTRQGRGSFVADAQVLHKDLRRIELEKAIEALLDTAARLGLSDKELLKQVQQLQEKRKKRAEA
jgi:GntR family transcriptional regulator